jgi:hypothetical protein
MASEIAGSLGVREVIENVCLKRTSRLSSKFDHASANSMMRWR